MMEKKQIRRRGLFLVFCFFLILVLAAGCSSAETEEEKIRDLEFTIAGPGEIPAELSEIIEQKKKESFRLTYSGGQELYIAAGYGEQKTGGYSICVPELYLTDNAITIKTELIGPDREAQAGTGPSWPYIVVKTEMIEKPVVFK